MSAERFLGVDVGGTKVAVGVVEAAAATDVVERPTVLSSAGALLDGIEVAVGEVVRRSGPPTAIGVGVPSMVRFATGEVVASVNIPLSGIRLREELGRRLGVPVYVDNDANCAALGEAQLVNDPPAQHLVMLTLGTGVGGGVVIGGMIFRGATGLGPELGHVVLEPMGPNCPGTCPNRGCLEALCSGQALERDATELARDKPESPLGQVLADGEPRVKGRDVVALARATDPDALTLMRRLGTTLGVAIAGFVNTFEPRHIVVGGGLSAAADLFLPVAEDEARSRALPAIVAGTTISLARGGPLAGVIGAGTLAAQEHARPGRAT